LKRALNSRYYRWAMNRIFPRRFYQYIHRWPSDRFRWTDKTVSFTFSFDCDNIEDSDSFPFLCDVLDRYEIVSSFAVIGEIVEEQADAYRELVRSGHEIINHGYSRHYDVDESGVKYATLFYDTMTPELMEREIDRNHHALASSLGVKPIGFRTPHFATFQRPEQLKRLHRILRERGYLFSTSSDIYHAKTIGMIGPTEGDFMEMPLSMIPGYPLMVFDSWNLLRAPNRRFEESDMVRLFEKMLLWAVEDDGPVFLNMYIDPDHVHASDVFVRMMQMLARCREDIWIGPYRDMFGE